MNVRPVTMVRIFLTEGEGRLKPLLDYLHDTAHVRGVTVYRGIAGFGSHGRLHTAALIDTSLDLPVTIEFAEDRDKAATIIGELAHRVDAGHIVHWDASLLE